MSDGDCDDEVNDSFEHEREAVVGSSSEGSPQRSGRFSDDVFGDVHYGGAQDTNFGDSFLFTPVEFQHQENEFGPDFLAETAAQFRVEQRALEGTDSASEGTGAASNSRSLPHPFASSPQQQQGSQGSNPPSVDNNRRRDDITEDTNVDTSNESDTIALRNLISPRTASRKKFTNETNADDIHYSVTQDSADEVHSSVTPPSVASQRQQQSLAPHPSSDENSGDDSGAYLTEDTNVDTSQETNAIALNTLVSSRNPVRNNDGNEASVEDNCSSLSSPQISSQVEQQSLEPHPSSDDDDSDNDDDESENDSKDEASSGPQHQQQNPNEDEDVAKGTNATSSRKMYMAEPKHSIIHSEDEALANKDDTNKTGITDGSRSVSHTDITARPENLSRNKKVSTTSDDENEFDKAEVPSHQTINDPDMMEAENDPIPSQDEIHGNISNEGATENEASASLETESRKRKKGAKTDKDGNRSERSERSDPPAYPDENDSNSSFSRSPKRRGVDPPSQGSLSPSSSPSRRRPPLSPGNSSKTGELRKQVEDATRVVPMPASDDSDSEQPRRPFEGSSSKRQSLERSRSHSSGRFRGGLFTAVPHSDDSASEQPRRPIDGSSSKRQSPEPSVSHSSGQFRGLDPSGGISIGSTTASREMGEDSDNGDNIDMDVDNAVDAKVDHDAGVSADDTSTAADADVESLDHDDSDSSSDEEMSSGGESTEAINDDSDKGESEARKSNADHGSFYDEDDRDKSSTDFEEYEDSASETPFFTPTKDLLRPGQSESQTDSVDESFQLQNLLVTDTPSSGEGRIFEDNDDEDDLSGGDTGKGSDLQYSVTSNRSGTSLGTFGTFGNTSLAYSLDTALEPMVRSQDQDAQGDLESDKQTTSQPPEKQNKSGNDDHGRKEGVEERKVTREPSNFGVKSAPTEADLGSSSSTRRVEESNLVSLSRQQQMISPVSQGFSFSSNKKSIGSSDGSKSYSERLVEMLRPFDMDGSLSSRMRHTCSFDQTESTDMRSVAHTESTDMRSHTAVDPEDSTMSRSTPEDSTMSRSIPEESLNSKSTPEESIMTPEDSIMSRSTPDTADIRSQAAIEPEDSTMSRSNPSGSSATITGSSNEESKDHTLHSMLATEGNSVDEDDEDDSSYYSSDDARSSGSDEESVMAESNFMQLSTGTKEDDGVDGGDDDTLGRSTSGDASEVLKSAQNQAGDADLRRQEIATGLHNANSGRSDASLLSETIRDDTLMTRKSIEKSNDSEIVPTAVSKSEPTTQSKDTGDKAPNVFLDAAGGTFTNANTEAETILPDENSDIKKDVQQYLSKKTRDDTSVGLISSTSNYSSQDEDIGDITRRILLKAIGSSDGIESTSSRKISFSDENKKEFVSSEKVTKIEVEGEDTPKIGKESLGASGGLSHSDEGIEVFDELDGDILSEHTSMTDDDVGDIARNILLKALGEPVDNDASPDSNENDAKAPDVKTNDEYEESVPSSTTSMKSDNIAAVARNIVNAAIVGSARKLFNEESEPSEQRNDNKTTEGQDERDLGNDEESHSSSDFSSEESVSEIARKIVQTAIERSSSTHKSRSMSHSESQSGSEGPTKNSHYFVHTSEESSVDDEQLSVNMADESENQTKLQSQIIPTPVDPFNEGHSFINSTESTRDISSVAAPQIYNRSGENVPVLADIIPMREDETIRSQAIRDMIPLREDETIRTEAVRGDVIPMREDETIRTEAVRDDMIPMREDETIRTEAVRDDILSMREDETIRSEADVKNLNAYRSNIEISVPPDTPTETQLSETHGVSEDMDDNSLSSGELAELDDLLDRHEIGEETNQDRLYELDLYDRWQNGENLSSEEIKDLNDFKARRRKVKKYKAELKWMRNLVSSGENVDRDRMNQLELLERESRRGTLSEEEAEVLAGFWKEEILDNSNKKSGESHKTFPVPSEIDKPPEKITDEHLSPKPGEQGANEPEEGVAGIDAENDGESDCSSLSTWELDELDSLIEQQEQGFNVPENRLRNLELFDKWQNDEVLDEGELKDLKRFKRQRKKERQYGRELIGLIDAQNRGEKIDEDRLEALELYARYHTGEELTKDELEILNDFERSEGISVHRSPVKETDPDRKEQLENVTENKSNDESVDDILKDDYIEFSTEDFSGVNAPILDSNTPFSTGSFPFIDKPADSDRDESESDSEDESVPDITRSKETYDIISPRASDLNPLRPISERSIELEEDEWESGSSSHSNDEEVTEIATPQNAMELSHEEPSGTISTLDLSKPPSQNDTHPNNPNSPSDDKDAAKTNSPQIVNDLSREEPSGTIAPAANDLDLSNPVSHSDGDESDSDSSSHSDDKNVAKTPQNVDELSHEDPSDTVAPANDLDLNDSPLQNDTQLDEDESDSDPSSHADDKNVAKTPQNVDELSHEKPSGTIAPAANDLDLNNPPLQNNTQLDEEDDESESDSSSPSDDEDVAKTKSPQNVDELSHEDPSDTVAPAANDFDLNNPPLQNDTQLDEEDDESDSDSSSPSDDEDVAKTKSPQNVDELSHEEPSDTVAPIVKDLDLLNPVYEKNARSDEDESDSDSSAPSDDENLADDYPRTESDNEVHSGDFDAAPTSQLQTAEGRSSDDDEFSDFEDAQSRPEPISNRFEEEETEDCDAPRATILKATEPNDSGEDDAFSEFDIVPAQPDTLTTQNEENLERNFELGGFDCAQDAVPQSARDDGSEDGVFGASRQPESPSTSSGEKAADDSRDFSGATDGAPMSAQDDNDSSSNSNVTRSSEIADAVRSSEVFHEEHPGAISPEVDVLIPRHSEEPYECGSNNNAPSLQKVKQIVDEEHDDDSSSSSDSKGSAKITNLLGSGEIFHGESSGSILFGDDSESEEDTSTSDSSFGSEDDSASESSSNSIDISSVKMIDQEYNSDRDSSRSKNPSGGNSGTQTDGSYSSHLSEDQRLKDKPASGFRDETSRSLSKQKKDSVDSPDKLAIASAPEVDETMSLSGTSKPLPPTSQIVEKQIQNENNDLSDSVVEYCSIDENDMPSHDDDGSSFYGSCKSENSLSNRADRFDDQRANNQSLPESLPSECDDIDRFHVANDILSLSDDDKSSYNSCQSQEKEGSESSVSRGNVDVKDGEAVDRLAREESKKTVSSNIASTSNEKSSSPGGENSGSSEMVLSADEIDELNELLDREESGEIVDEDRIYELDLLSRWQVGERLEDEELVDLNRLKAKRKKQRESNQMSGSPQRAEGVRSVAHFDDKKESQMESPLETMKEEMVPPESLSIQERFPVLEQLKEAKETKKTIPSFVDNTRTSAGVTNQNKFVDEKSLAEEIESMKERERAKMEAERKRLEEMKRILADEEKRSKLAKQKRIEEETRMAKEIERMKDLELKRRQEEQHKRQEEQRRQQEESRLLKERSKMAEEIELMKERERAKMMVERQRLEEKKKKMIADEEKRAKLAKQKKLEEETRMAKEVELIKELELKREQEERRRREEESRLIDERLQMEAEQRRLEKEIILAEEQMKIEAERNKLARDALLAEEKILAKQKKRMKLEEEAQLAEEERISKETMRMKLEISEPSTYALSYSDEMRKAAEDAKRRIFELEATKRRLATAAISGGLDAPSFEETSNSSSSVGSSITRESEHTPLLDETSNSSSSDGISLGRESYLSLREMDELDELLNREENGESVNEDRIYELDLFARYQLGDELDKDEIADLDDFRARRRNTRHRTKQKTRQGDDNKITNDLPQRLLKNDTKENVNVIDEPKAIQKAKLKSHEASSSLSSGEKQTAEQRRNRHRSSLPLSSPVSSPKHDQEKLKRGESLGKSGSKSSFSSNENSGRIGGYSEGDSISFVGGNISEEAKASKVERLEKQKTKSKKDDQSYSPRSTSTQESMPPRSTESQKFLHKKHDDIESASRRSSESKSQRTKSEDRTGVSVQSDRSKSSTDKSVKERMSRSPRSALGSERKYNAQRSTKTHNLRHENHEDIESASRGSSRSRSKSNRGNIDSNVRTTDSMQSTGSRSSTNELGSNALQSSWRYPTRILPEKASNGTNANESRRMSHRKNELKKSQEGPARASKQKIGGSEQDKSAEISTSSKVIEKASHSLQAWDSLDEGSPKRPQRDNDEASSLVDIEKGTSSWLRSSSWNPFSHIKRQQPEYEFLSNKADPPILDIPRRRTEEHELLATGGPIYVHRTTDDSSIASNWGPPTLLKKERNRKINDVNRNHQFEIDSESSSSPKEYGGQSFHKTGIIRPTHYSTQQVPFIVKSQKPSDKSASDSKKSKGFDPNELLSSWGFPLVGNRPEQDPSEEKKSSHIETLLNERRISPEYQSNYASSNAASITEESFTGYSSTSSQATSQSKGQRMPLASHTHSTSSVTDYAASPVDERRLQGENRSDGFSSEFTTAIDSTGEGSQGTNYFDVEQGTQSLKDYHTASEFSRSASEDGSNSRSTNSRSGSSSVPISILSEQNSDEHANSTHSDFVVEQSGKQKSRRSILGFIILGIILIALIAGGLTTLFIFLNRNKAEDQTPTASPFQPPSPLVPSPAPMASTPNTIPPNKDDSLPPQATVPTAAPINDIGDDNIIIDDNSLYNLIVTNAPDGGASLNDPSSPQSAAFKWLEGPENAGFSQSRLLQRYALATLYYATNPNNNNWKTTSLWLSDNNECAWYSTTEELSDVCTRDSEDSSIYEVLDLRENGLKGSIPEELSLLTALKEIRLSTNDLTGSIPSLLASLDSLEYLDLSSNQLIAVGNEITFMNGMQNMQSLVHLDLFQNSLQTTIPPQIWGEGSPLSSTLKVLNLGSNQFYGTLPTEIGFLTKLTGLSVFDNDLSGQLPASISRLPLELLYVDSNKFTNTVQAPGVPQAICDLRPEPLKEFWADCDEIGCTCCTTCCSGEVGCIAA